VGSFGLDFFLLAKSSILPPVMSFGSDVANNYGWTSIIESNISDWYVLFLGPFAKLRKAAISFIMSVCMSVRPSVRMEQLGSRWTDFHEILIFGDFSKIVKKIQVALKSDKNSWYFT